MFLPAAEPQLSPLAPVPDWSSLEPYQRTITQEDFSWLINSVYSPDGGFWKFTIIQNDTLQLFSDAEHQHPLFTFHFAANAAKAVPPPNTYHTQVLSKDPVQPLKGLRIALDPGHIGGDWAVLEERHFKLGNDPAVEEGQLNLTTCQILAELLQADGAEVVWAKHDLKPVTKLRPEDLRDEALAALKQEHKSVTDATVDHQAALLFYRVAEIRARAEKINKLKPDLTICVHYNADDWGNPDHPTLTPTSRLVIFVNGAYEHSELLKDDIKFDLLRKLLDRTAVAEEKGCSLVGQALLQQLKYPPESFIAYFAHHLTAVPSVYARNLLANRIYHGPVIYCEGPYMNARDAYPRLIAGDYIGTKLIAGEKVPSIYRSYAKGIEAGVLKYFQNP